MGDTGFDYKAWKAQSDKEFWERIEYLKEHDPKVKASLSAPRHSDKQLAKSHVAAMLFFASFAFGAVGFIAYPYMLAEALALLAFMAAVIVPGEDDVVKKLSVGPAIAECALIVFSFAVLECLLSGNQVAMAAMFVLAVLAIVDWARDFMSVLNVRFNEKELAVSV